MLELATILQYNQCMKWMHKIHKSHCTNICRSVQRTSILDVPEDEETAAAAEGVEEITNEIENKNETDETWMFYTAMQQPIQQLWYYLVPSS